MQQQERGPPHGGGGHRNLPRDNRSSGPNVVSETPANNEPAGLARLHLKLVRTDGFPSENRCMNTRSRAVIVRMDSQVRGALRIDERD